MGRKLFIAVGLLLLLTSEPAWAAENVDLEASLDGHELTGSTPVRLEPDRPLEVDLAITNRSNEEITVESVRVAGEVLNLAFFSYEARIGVPVAPGATEERSLVIDLVGLEGQATGHIPAELTLLDGNRDVITSDEFTSDVRGSAWSVYGIFGWAIAAITAVILLGAAIRLALGRLPPNRWSRAVRFGVGGLGLGLTLTIALSAFRVLTPHPSSSLGLVVGCGIALFILGYLTPTPGPDDDDDEELAEDRVDLDEDQGDLDLRDTAQVDEETATRPVASSSASGALSTMARTGPAPAPWSSVTDDDRGGDADSGDSTSDEPTPAGEPRGTIVRDAPLPPPDGS